MPPSPLPSPLRFLSPSVVAAVVERGGDATPSTSHHQLVLVLVIGVVCRVHVNVDVSVEVEGAWRLYRRKSAPSTISNAASSTMGTVKLSVTATKTCAQCGISDELRHVTSREKEEQNRHRCG